MTDADRREEDLVDNKDGARRSAEREAQTALLREMVELQEEIKGIHDSLARTADAPDRDPIARVKALIRSGNLVKRLQEISSEVQKFSPETAANEDRNRASVGGARKAGSDGVESRLTRENTSRGGHTAEWQEAKENAVLLFKRGDLQGASTAIVRTVRSMDAFRQVRNVDDPQNASYWAWHLQHESDLLRLWCNVYTHQVYDEDRNSIFSEGTVTLAESSLAKSWELQEPDQTRKSIQAYSLILTKAVFHLCQASDFRRRMKSDSVGREFLDKAARELVNLRSVRSQVPEALLTPALELDARRAHAALSGDWKQAAALEKQLRPLNADIVKEHARIGAARAPRGPEPPKRSIFGRKS